MFSVSPAFNKRNIPTAASYLSAKIRTAWVFAFFFHCVDGSLTPTKRSRIKSVWFYTYAVFIKNTDNLKKIA